MHLETKVHISCGFIYQLGLYNDKNFFAKQFESQIYLFLLTGAELPKIF